MSKFSFLLINFYRDGHLDKVKNLILDVLYSQVTESDSVSVQLLDVISSNIVEPLKLQENGYRLAKELLLHNDVFSGSILKNYIKRVDVVLYHIMALMLYSEFIRPN